MTGQSPLPPVTGIVLAGGRSRRFGRNKLVEPVAAKPLVRHAIDALAQVTTDLIVVAAPGMELRLPDGVRLAHDDTPFEGPLAGCLAGLTLAREPLVLIVGGDMPTLRPAVLGSMVRVLATTSVDACVLEQGGRARPLPMALRTGTGTALVARLLADHERRLGAILERLIVRAIPEMSWRPLDPEGATLRDVDVPADLEGLGTD